jgi:uncharacterized protein
MNLETKIMAEMKEAMKAKAAILLLKTSGSEVTEDAELKMLQKMVKQRKDSLEIYQQQNRTDLAQKEEEEIKLIEKFLPQQMSEDELKLAVQKVIIDTGASSAADMGKVMGVATRQLAGKADGKAISAVVKELLK